MVCFINKPFYTINSIPKNETLLFCITNLANTLDVSLIEKDNVLPFLISKYNRQMTITTGNKKKIITDIIVKEIINQTITLKFKDGLYFEGLNEGLDSIIYKWN